MPVLGGEYPADMLEVFGPAAPDIQPGDMELIGAPLDYVGINYYTRMVVAHDPEASDPLMVKMPRVEGAEYTEMGWEVYPDGLRELLVRMHAQYQLQDIYITENGCAMPDVLDADGQVHDPRRVAYLKAHLQATHQAIEQGVPVRGYFVWSILDNFEWAEGYSKRFGLVYVDYPTQRRIPKDSYRFYQQVIADNAVPEG
jgi:beta-glucosidase